MQLFVTSVNPKDCAKYLDNRRLNKQLLECCQVLSSSLYLKKKKHPYKPTHLNHPIVKWCNSDSKHFDFVWSLGFWCAIEYYNRFNKIHKCSNVLDKIAPLTSTHFSYEDITFYDLSNETTDNVFNNYKLCLLKKWNKDRKGKEKK